MFQSTRRRLTLWYASITAILLLVLASGVYGYVRATLIERIDDTLNHVVEVVERSLVIEPAEDGLVWMLDGRVSQRVNVEASFRNNALFRNDDDRIDLEWFSANGELQWSTFNIPLPLPLSVSRREETVQIDLEKSPDRPYREPLLLRQLTERVELGRQVLGYLRVSHPWFEVTKPTRQLVADLAIGLVILVIVVGAIGWFLSGLAMRPVQESYQSLKQFTADASHELRTPIAIIQANVQLALSELGELENLG
ncbi:MAG: histidine kinase dimerization/phospho-acceptor domain-containing protein, partial [Prochlorotrichaceae cyanobacterium]